MRWRHISDNEEKKQINEKFNYRLMKKKYSKEKQEFIASSLKNEINFCFSKEKKTYKKNGNSWSAWLT